MDVDGSGSLSYDEFLLWWAGPNRFKRIKMDEDTQKFLIALSENFQYFDKDKSGCLNEEEFIHFHNDLLARKVVATSLNDVFEKMDRNSDKVVSFNEYIDFIISKH